ncbi:type II secretion system protein J [Brachymonas denitrificans]|uniref:PulJ/GspJ family protein n=1 Tax=Brachymonas denitrificans TaxID=28220 RepID=UPI00352FC7C4
MRTSPVRQRGFTLIELMVAIGILALVALLSWRGLDAMVRVQQGTQNRSDQIAVVQTALAQWRVDLDAMLPGAGGKQPVLDWDGRTLRVLRLASPETQTATEAGAGQAQQSLWTPATVVVAWTLRSACPRSLADASSGEAANGAAPGPCWMRWQSPQLRTHGEQQQAWQQAASWGSGAQGEAAGSQVMLPLQAWEVLGYRDDVWGPVKGLPVGNAPAGGTGGTGGTGDTGGIGGAGGASSGTPGAAPNPVPDGLRLQLTLPGQGTGIAGSLTVDWLQPTLTRERS